jgi:thiamine-phosphate pyrophosphorylase
VSRLSGLYAITPEAPAATPPLAVQVEQAIAGGARLIQYRDKSGTPQKRLREATDLLAVCRANRVPLIVNDDLDLAERIGADGVHLGREDAPPPEARRRLGPGAVIGVSCYDQLERAVAAQATGADYAAFGRFFPSATKPLAVQATPDLLRRARRRLTLPLVAIGGITPENGAALISAGADMLAAVDAIFGQPDIRTAAAAIARLFP